MPHRWDRSTSVGENARTRLPSLAQEYFGAGRTLMDGEPPAAALHRFRLKTKRFRYTLELFRVCYGPQIERYLAQLRKIQDWLGAINDSATTRRLVAGVMRRRSPEWNGFDRFLLARTRENVAEFQSYWKRIFDKPGEEQRLVRYLSRVSASK
jgi:CHAD domain-containing protein